jgi:hypothetical protein
MRNIGVALVDMATGTIEQQWDGMPDAIAHAGEVRTGAIVGAEFAGGRLLVNRLCANPPAGYYPVTAEQSSWDGTNVVVVRSYGSPDLARHKAEAKASVGLGAEMARCKYISPGSGKVMSYQQVAAEAIRYGATGGAGAYPFLQARVASGRYPDLATAAAATQQIEAQWAAIGSAIDQSEDAAKLAIDAATTVEQVQAVTVVTWP